METYDDRPISVYDNLNMPTVLHTGTAKSRAHTIAAAVIAAKETAERGRRYSPPPPPSSPSQSPHSEIPTNGAARSPYADISFKFNDSMRPQPTHPTHPIHEPSKLPNGKPDGTPRAIGGGKQVHPGYGSTPYKTRDTDTDSPQKSPTTAAPIQSSARRSSSSTSTATSPTGSTTSTPTSAAVAAHASAAAIAISAAQRPLSQHSQAELNEASQGIAAVKAALNDAKSKFFGLNGHDEDSDAVAVASPPIAYKPQPDTPQSRREALVITPEPKSAPPKKRVPPPKPPQPKYQNIPHNSAICRHLQPPELPPKPSQFSGHPRRIISGVTSSEPVMDAGYSGTAFTPSPQPRSSSPVKIQAYSAYQQIPLNDIDSSQPSQAVYMSTTVPQNIKGTKIAGRHTPTRNSLRHSRMLVVNNKNYQGVEYPNPMNFKQPKLARWLLILQIAVGLLISFLAIWILFLAPNTAIQDNPYWSGLALWLAGVLGLVLIRFQRIKRHKVRENCFRFLRADSFLLAMTAALLCSIALVYAALHFTRLTADDTKCASSNILLEHGSCSCTFNMATMAQNSTLNATAADANADEAEQPIEDISYTVEYRDMSCKELAGEFISILGLSIVLNSIGVVLSILFVMLLICCREGAKRIYTSVHTSTF